jgi:hypothetical protein
MVPQVLDRMNLETIAKGELEPGEKLLWIGKPNPTRIGRQSYGLYCFAVPWTAFALFWMVGASGMLFHPTRGPSGPIGYIGPLFGLPFVGIGLAMLSAPYWIARKARSTIYAITDKRAMIIVAGKTRCVESYTRSDMTDIQRTELSDGSGDLVFARRFRASSDSSTGMSATNIGFYGIPQVRAIERLMIDTFKQDGG